MQYSPCPPNSLHHKLPSGSSLTSPIFAAIRRGSENQPTKKPRSDGAADGTNGSSRDHLAYDCLLRNELLNAQIEELRGPPANCADGNRAALGAVQLASQARAALAYSPPVFRFRAPPHNAEVSGGFFDTIYMLPETSFVSI